MNRPVHRLATCLGKAALKTHAFQTLPDYAASPNRAKRLECVRFIDAFGFSWCRPGFVGFAHFAVPSAFSRIISATSAPRRGAHIGEVNCKAASRCGAIASAQPARE